MAQLISNLPVGSKVKFGMYSVESEAPQPITWLIADKGHTGYPSGAVTLVANEIIDQRAFDGKEPSNSDSNRQIYGNNRYRDSNIRQWLNKSGYPWYSATHGADSPPTDLATNDYGTGYDDKSGFLSDFTSDELGALLDTTLTVALNTVTDGGGSETVTDKVFLLSNTEAGLENENSIAEGSLLPLFSGDASRISTLTQQSWGYGLSADKPGVSTDPWYWWLRSPHAGSSYGARYVYSSGASSGLDARYGSVGVRPALNLKSEIFVSDEPDFDGAYVVTFNETPIIAVSQATFPTVKFTTSDNDGTVQSARVLLNGVEKQAYNATDVLSEMSYTIQYPDLVEGDNTLKIEATDDKSGVGEKILTVNKAGISTPAIGTKIIAKGKEYEIVNVVSDGLNMTLTLDRALEENIVVDEGVEILNENVFPFADMGTGLQAMQHVKTVEENGQMHCEYKLDAEGRTAQFCLDMQKEAGSTFEIKEPKAIFRYKED